MASSLIDVLRTNPGAHIVLDNDCFWVYENEEAEESIYGGFDSDPNDLLELLIEMQGFTSSRV